MQNIGINQNFLHFLINNFLGRSPTSPHRRNRDQKQQKLHNISQQQQNALLNFHSSRSTNYSRYLPPGNSGKNLDGKNQRTGRLPSSATEVLHFPAEYQVFCRYLSLLIGSG